MSFDNLIALLLAAFASMCVIYAKEWIWLCTVSAHWSEKLFEESVR